MEAGLHGIDPKQQKEANMFILSEDETQIDIIKRAVNNWYDPTSHGVNVAWEAGRQAPSSS